MEKFYITTPIFYSNDVPHIGHSYTVILADVISRWERSKQKQVLYLTGMDEHGKKIAQAAEKAGVSPQEYTDQIAEKFKIAWKKLDISYDDFIRTTEKRHIESVNIVLNKLKQKGDIYLGTYEGLYCVGCESYKTEKELVDGKCPLHNTFPEKISEKNYFFKLSKYKDQVIKLIEKEEMKIVPQERKNEVLSFLKNEELKDLAISRPTVKWAIPIPFDPEQYTYVWVEALCNYISVIGYGKDQTKFKTYWPADLHLMAKDILKFHAIIWPAILLSLGEKPPKKQLIHGYFTANGQKMSKTIGNVIDPIYLVDKYGADPIRYFILRETPIGGDGDFSENGLVVRVNTELANGLGNLLNRTVALAEKKLDGKISKQKTDAALAKQLELEKIIELNDSFAFHLALGKIFDFVSACNKYVNDQKPWEQSEKEAAVTLYNLVDSLRVIAILLEPFIPSTVEKINQQIGVKKGMLSEAKLGLLKNTTIQKGPILFNKIELSPEEVQKPEIKAREINVIVEDAVTELGLKVISGVVEGIKVKKKHEGLEKLKEKTAQEVNLKDKNRQAIISEYENIYKNLGIKNVTNSVRNLDELVEKSKQLPQINTAVDCYNLVSLRHGLVVGCHDLDKLKGNLGFVITSGAETYIPLGGKENKGVTGGEFGVIDEQQLVCRLDEKQCEGTKVANETKNIVFYVQGNRKTPVALLEKAANEIGELITQYCGGQYRLVGQRKKN